MGYWTGFNRKNFRLDYSDVINWGLNCSKVSQVILWSRIGIFTTDDIEMLLDSSAWQYNFYAFTSFSKPGECFFLFCLVPDSLFYKHIDSASYSAYGIILYAFLRISKFLLSRLFILGVFCNIFTEFCSIFLSRWSHLWVAYLYTGNWFSLLQFFSYYHQTGSQDIPYVMLMHLYKVQKTQCQWTKLDNFLMMRIYYFNCVLISLCLDFFFCIKSSLSIRNRIKIVTYVDNHIS